MSEARLSEVVDKALRYAAVNSRERFGIVAKVRVLEAARNGWQGRAEALEAEIVRLTDHKEALRKDNAENFEGRLKAEETCRLLKADLAAARELLDDVVDLAEDQSMIHVLITAYFHDLNLQPPGGRESGDEPRAKAEDGRRIVTSLGTGRNSPIAAAKPPGEPHDGPHEKPARRVKGRGLAPADDGAESGTTAPEAPSRRRAETEDGCGT